MTKGSAHPPEPQVAIHGSYVDTSFITASLDDAGLTPYEFRVYCRILRRAQGKNGQPCYETRKKIALATGMSDRQVSRALSALRQRGMIRVDVQKGNWLHIWPLPSGMWGKVWTDSPHPLDSESTPSSQPVQTQGTPVQGNPDKDIQAASPVSPEKEKKKGEFFDFALQCWNEMGASNWTKHRVLTPRAQGQLRRFAKWAHEAALFPSPAAAFEAAVKYAASGDYWRKADGLALVNLASNDRLCEMAEKATQAPTPLDSKSKRLLGHLVAPGRVFEAGSQAIFQAHPVEVVAKKGPLYQVRTAEGNLVTAYPDELTVREQEEDE